MHHERLKGVVRAFHHSFRAFHEIQNVDAPQRVMRRFSREPVAAGFDEFAHVETRPLFLPSVAFADGFLTAQEILANPFRGPVPLNVFAAVLKMNGARPALEDPAGPNPIT